MTRTLAMDSYLLADAESVVARARQGDEAAARGPVPGLRGAGLQPRPPDLPDHRGRGGRAPGDLLRGLPEHRPVPGGGEPLGLDPDHRREQGAHAAPPEQVPGHRRAAGRGDGAPAGGDPPPDGPRGGAGAAARDLPRRGLAARRRGLHPRRDRRDDGQDPQLLEVAAGPGARPAPALARRGGAA